MVAVVAPRWAMTRVGDPECFALLAFEIEPPPPPFEQLCLTEHVSSIRIVEDGVRTTITEVRG